MTTNIQKSELGPQDLEFEGLGFGGIGLRGLGVRKAKGFFVWFQVLVHHHMAELAPSLDT